MSIGYEIVQLEVVERVMERFRLERQIREVKAETARKRALLRARQAAGGRMVEMRPMRGPRFRRLSPEESQRNFEQAMRKIEKTHPLTAARFRAQRASR